MDSLNVFDAACTVGRHRTLQKGGLHAAKDLLGEMDHFGIAEALVVDCLSRECHPLSGNERVLKAAAASPRLHPAWAALPPGAAEDQLEPGELLRQMRSNKVGALHLFTGVYRFSLSDWCIDALLEPLAAERVPVIIVPNDLGNNAMDQTDWGGVVDLCRRWPGLPVIVSEHRIRRSQRLAYRALDACPNLRIEMSGYWLSRGVEYVTRRWGADRLIFGSNWPTFGQGMTLAFLTAAGISDEDKKKIAGGNLRELISWCEPAHPKVKETRPADEFVRFGRTGRRPAKMRFDDCHGHLGGRGSHYHIPDGSLDETVAEMERLGVEKCCVFSFAGVVSDEVHGNDIVADAVKRHPDRFVGFTLLNPHRGEDEMLRELDRCARKGLRGIKLIPWYQGYPTEGPNVDVACRWAHERRQIILNHDWGSQAQMERLLKTYPNACFFTGHTTTAFAEMMKCHENLFVCSCPLLTPRACEQVVASIGAERLLFGSDLQDLPIAWGLGPILFARLSAADKRLILGGNLRRVLSRYSLRA